ncbi:DUF6803 family protein [Mesobacillus zeae]|uniref:Permease n=1 Tax=Mesobacillus zeae TaxID=1917180 RepID=A0A398B3A8_9BACI|nr:DUF6803 family protein [Mesobacillus zeae]RID83884.1 permease [Mesobacillus zeae]
MDMTHYMELLADNQPWNLILFMAIPVILAETIAISELAILYTRKYSGGLWKLNKVCSILAGLYFTGVFSYLFVNVVIPLTSGGQWRGAIDVIAVGFYLLGVVPLLGMALLDMNLIWKNKSIEQKLKIHAFFVGFFLVVAHVAMIFGMLDPRLGSGTEGHSHMDM